MYYAYKIWARDIYPLFNRALILESARYHPHGKTRSPNTAGPDLARYQEARKQMASYPSWQDQDESNRMALEPHRLSQVSHYDLRSSHMIWDPMDCSTLS